MPTIHAADLIDLTARVFVAGGAPPDIARIVAESLVQTNLLGHDSHGVIRVPEYIQKIRDGYLQPTARPQIASQLGGTMAVDCGWGFGQVGGRYGAEQAAKLAQQSGIGGVALQQVNHVGRLGEYVDLLARQGLIGIAIAAGSMYHGTVAPYGGRERLMGTNPIAWAVPTGPDTPPLISDFATSAQSMGKILVALSREEPLPPDVLLTSDGQPTTDPAIFHQGGVLLPFGAYKGYGLALMIEILTTALCGFAPVSSQEFQRGNPMLLIAIRVDAFTAPARFERLVRELMANVKAIQPAAGFDEVLLPGELETRAYAERRANGIPLPEATWAALQSTAAELGVI